MSAAPSRIRLAALTALTAVLASAAGAHAETTRTYTYVANSFGYYTELDESQPAGMAVAGQLRFTPRGRSVTIRVDDGAILDGQTVAVWIGGFRCLRVRAAETIQGLTPSREMMVVIMADGAWLPAAGPGCTGHATAGTAEVTV